MNKFLKMIILTCCIATFLVACTSVDSESKEINDQEFVGITADMWLDDNDYYICKYSIIYDSKTKVKYLIVADTPNGDGGGITPLYNADGTLQLWEGE